MSKQPKIKIRLKAFDHRILDKAINEIVSTVKRIGAGARVRGPIALPRCIKRFTVNRSPHIDKKSREQFEMREFTRVIYIDDAGPQAVDALSKVELAAGVEVEVKL